MGEADTKQRIGESPEGTDRGLAESDGSPTTSSKYQMKLGKFILQPVMNKLCVEQIQGVGEYEGGSAKKKTEDREGVRDDEEEGEEQVCDAI